MKSFIKQRFSFLSAVILTATAALADAPTCDNVTATALENSATTPIVLSCSDEDGDIDAQTYTVVNQPSLGSVLSLFEAPPVIASYVSDTGKSGADSFTYSVSDAASNHAAPATVSIDVLPLPHGGLYASPGAAGCFLNPEGAGSCDHSAAGLTGISQAVMSPDGKNIYSISIGSNVLAVVNVASDGSLSQFQDTRSCFSQDGTADPSEQFQIPMTACQTLNKLDSLAGIAVSPEGKHVYLAASDSILTFSRDTAGQTPGTLTYQGCISASGLNGCSHGNSLSLTGVAGLTFSPDGKSLYALSSTPSFISVLSRNLSTGVLSQPDNPSGCFGDGTPGCTPLAGLDAVRSMVISPDGSNLYTFSTQQLNTFVRDQTSGALSVPLSGANCINADASNGCSAGRNFSGAMTQQLLAAPNGSNLYLVSDLGIAVFSRSAQGLVSQAAGTNGCVNSTGNNGCASFWGGDFLTQAAIARDGRTLYASRDDLNQRLLIGWAVSKVDGTLTPLNGGFSCVSDTGDCVKTPFALSASYTALLFPPSGAHFYTAVSGTQNGLYSFAINRTPACVDSSISSGGAVTVSLSCSDSDSEPVTISVVATPSHGTLGAVNSQAGTVLYQPANGWHGTDSFTFAASDGTEGEAAVAQVTTLQAAPTPTATPTLPLPTATPFPTAAPGQPFEVRGVVLYMGQPVSGALVVCESIGAVLTTPDGTFDCGTSSAPVSITISRPGYSFGTVTVTDGSTPLVVEATGAQAAPSQCTRREYLRDKLAIHNSLISLSAAAGNSQRLAAGRKLLEKTLAVRIHAGSWREHRRASAAARRLPDFSDTCPSGTSCRIVKVTNLIRTVTNRALLIRRAAVISLQTAIAMHRDGGTVKRLQKSLFRQTTKLRNALKRLPQTTHDCST